MFQGYNTPCFDRVFTNHQRFFRHDWVSEGIQEKLGWTHGVDRWDGPVGWVLGLDRWAWAQGQDLNKVRTSKLLANVYLLAQ